MSGKNIEVNDGRDYGAFIPSQLDDYPLCPIEFRVYSRVARRAGGGATHFESVARMASALRVSERKVHYSLRLLVAAKMLEEKRRKGRTTVYTLTSHFHWLPGDQVNDLRIKIKKGHPSLKPVHKRNKTTSALGAVSLCTECSGTSASDAVKGTPVEGSSPEGIPACLADPEDENRFEEFLRKETILLD